MRTVLLLLAAATVLGGCATAGGVTDGGRRDAGAERGLRFAQRACAGCHALDAGQSPRGAAPPFASLRLRYNSISLERRLAEISAHGHIEMPPIFISADEAKDIGSYIASLDGR